MMQTTSYRTRKKFNAKKIFKYIIGIILFIIIIVVVGFFTFTKKQETSANITNQNNKISKEIPVNKSYKFPVNSSDEENDTITYTIEKAELQHEIIIKGKKASSIPGRVFLVLTIKLTNDLDTPIKINTRDYIRLSVNDSDERLAFSIHNDPVTIDPISTKPTRLALPIDDKNQKLTLFVGEIKGKKEKIDLTF